MSQRRTIVRNILSGYVSLAIQMAVRVVQLGLLVRMLGESGLGLVTLFLAAPNISQIAGYSLSKGTVRYMSLSMAKGDRAGILGYFNSSFLAYSGLSLLVTLGVLALYPFLDAPWLAIPHALRRDAQVSLLIIAAGLLVTLPFTAAQGACQAAQRHDLVAAARTAVLLLQLAIYVLAFLMDALTVPLTFAVLFGTRALECLAWWVIARRAFPGLALSFHAVSRGTIAAVLLFAASAVTIDLANIVAYEGFKFLLKARLDLNLLGAYGAFATVAAAVWTVTSLPTSVLMPVAGKYDGLQDRERLDRLYYLGTKLTTLAAAGIVLPLLPFVRVLLARGISESVADHWVSCAVLLVGQLLAATSSTAGVMLAGVGRQRLQVQVMLVWVVVGTAGSALALRVEPPVLLWPIVAMSVARGLGGVWLAEVGRRVFCRTWPAARFWWNVLGLPVAAGLVSTLLEIGLQRTAPGRSHDVWFQGAIFLLGLALFAALAWFAVLGPDERREFILRRPGLGGRRTTEASG